MSTRDEPLEILVGSDGAGEKIDGTLVSPAPLLPGILFVHGWGGNQAQYHTRAREVAALGCMCLTFDLRGHAGTAEQRDRVTREDNLVDIIAAYDRLVECRGVDSSAIAVCGSSYGAYLAALLTEQRPVRWLGLRVPALYPDGNWHVPKQHLDRDELRAYRHRLVRPDENRALRACEQFTGDVLIVESEYDDIIPHEVIQSYVDAFAHAHSLTYRAIEADHGLSDPLEQRSYTALLAKWLGEMVFAARVPAAVTPPGSASAAR